MGTRGPGSKINVEGARTLKGQGKSLREIGIKYGVTGEAVRLRLKEGNGTKQQAAVGHRVKISKRKLESEEEFLRYLKTMSVNDLDDKTIKILDWAIKHPELSDAVNRLQNIVYTKNELIKQLQLELDKAKEKERKVQLVQGRQVIHGD